MTFEQRLAKVNLQAVMKHVQEDTGMDEATLARAEDLYRKFLTLKGQDFTRSLVPPRIVDLVWHAHITFTRQYMADCDMLFGEYLHHTPTDEDTTESFETGTMALFEREFGIVLTAYGLPAHMVARMECGG